MISIVGLLPRILSVFVAVLCSSLSLAADPYGTKSDTYLNAKFFATLSIPRVEAAGYKVSGTNISVNCIAKVETASSSDPNKITHVRLKRAKLQWNVLENPTVYDYVYPVDWSSQQGDGPGTYDLAWQPHDIVFSSVCQSNGSANVFTLTLTYEVKRQDGAVEERPPLVTTIEATSHNVVALWRTYVDDNGNAQSPTQNLLLHAGYDLMHQYYDAANHGFSTNESTSLVDLKSGLYTATAMAGIMHGSQTGVTDSTGVGNGHTLLWADFSPELNHHGVRYSTPTSTMIPPTNISLFYSCGTMPGADNGSLNFWMMRSPLTLFPIGTRINSALGGFDVAIQFYNDPVPPNTPPEQLPSSVNHIRVIYDEMYENGVTFGRAVALANVAFPPRAENPAEPRGAANMRVKGDAESTFYWVYVPPAKRSAPDYRFAEVLYITTPPPPGN